MYGGGIEKKECFFSAHYSSYICEQWYLKLMAGMIFAAQHMAYECFLSITYEIEQVKTTHRNEQIRT